MSKNKRPAKRHRPQATLMNPMHLLLPAAPLDGMLVLTRFHTALDMMARHQHPGKAEWQDLADCINTIETLVIEMHRVPKEVMPTVHAAAAGMANCALRHRAGQGFRMDGLGLGHLRLVVAMYADCLSELTAAEMARARQLTEARVAKYRLGAATDREVIAV